MAAAQSCGSMVDASRFAWRKIRQAVAERLVRRSLVERNGVFVERSDEPVSRNIVEPFTTVAGLIPFTRILGARKLPIRERDDLLRLAYVISFAASLGTTALAELTRTMLAASSGPPIFRGFLDQSMIAVH